MRKAYGNLLFPAANNEQLLPEKVRCWRDRMLRSTLTEGNLEAQEGKPEPAPSPPTSSIICDRSHTLPLSFMCAHMLFLSLSSSLSLTHAQRHVSSHTPQSALIWWDPEGASLSFSMRQTMQKNYSFPVCRRPQWQLNINKIPDRITVSADISLCLLVAYR